MSGLRGYSSNISISLDQLEDEIVEERLQIIKEYALKGVYPKEDLMMTINCIPIDCKSIERCCLNPEYGEPVAHFEIPQILIDYGIQSINYIGATDRQLPFIWYYNTNQWNTHKYRKRGKNKPYVYIDVTPNSNNMYDGYIFNAPYLRSISITAIFKDPRQVAEYDCCNKEDIDNISFLNDEIKRRLIEKKLRWYRQFAAQPVINDQIPR